MLGRFPVVASGRRQMFLTYDFVRLPIPFGIYLPRSASVRPPTAFCTLPLIWSPLPSLSREPLAPFPLASPSRFSRSVRLHAGCRLGRLRASPKAGLHPQPPSPVSNLLRRRPRCRSRDGVGMGRFAVDDRSLAERAANASAIPSALPDEFAKNVAPSVRSRRMRANRGPCDPPCRGSESAPPPHRQRRIRYRRIGRLRRAKAAIGRSRSAAA